MRGSRRTVTLNRHANGLKNSVEIVFHFFVREPQESDSELLNIVLSFAVFLELPLMRAAVNFDSQ